MRATCDLTAQFEGPMSEQYNNGDLLILITNIRGEEITLPNIRQGNNNPCVVQRLRVWGVPPGIVRFIKAPGVF